MKLSENIKLAKRIESVGLKEYGGITTINVRKLLDAFYAEPEIKASLDRLAK